MEDDEVKNILLNIIRRWEHDLINNRCTPTQMKSLCSLLINNVDMDASLDEIADHFGQSKSNVSNIIARRFTGKPKRQVLYPLQKIIKIVPRSWLRPKGE